MSLELPSQPPLPACGSPSVKIHSCSYLGANLPAPTVRTIGVRDSGDLEPNAINKSALAIQDYSKGKIYRITAQILASRGFVAGEELKKFLSAGTKSLPTFDSLKNFPELQQEILKLFDLLVDFQRSQRCPALVNDFDADGFTATAIFAEFLTLAGIPFKIFETRRSDVSRGVTRELVERIVNAGMDGIITFDMGTENGEHLRHAKSLARARRSDKPEFATVVIDHHDVRANLESPSDLFINFCRPGWEVGDAVHATAGMSLLICRWLTEITGRENPFRRIKTDQLLDLAAIGTTCDMMDLVGDNRAIARAGCRVLARTERPGLRALHNLLHLDSAITTDHIGLFIGPCLNAAGRMNRVDMVIELLITRDASRAEELAKALFNLNRERRILQRTMIRHIAPSITEKTVREPALTAYVPTYVENGVGVAGLVANFYGERYLIPTFVSFLDSNGNFTGSARGIREDVNIHEAYADPGIRPLLISGGGHHAVGGHVIPTENRNPLSDRLKSNIAKQTAGREPDRSVGWDLEVSLSEISVLLLNNIEKYAGPFGSSNPPPRFFVQGLAVERVDILKGGHLMLTVHQSATEERPAVERRAFLWNSDFHPALKAGAVIDVVCTAAYKPYAGQRSEIHLEIYAAQESSNEIKDQTFFHAPPRGVWKQTEAAFTTLDLGSNNQPMSLIRPIRQRGTRQKKSTSWEQETLTFNRGLIAHPAEDAHSVAAAAQSEESRPATQSPLTMAELARKHRLSVLNTEKFHPTEERLEFLDFVLSNPDINVVYQSPTGSGKSFINSAIMSGPLSDNERILLLTPQVELTTQQKKDIAAVLHVDYDAVISVSGEVPLETRMGFYRSLDKKVLIATPQIISRDFVSEKLYSFRQFKNVFGDEIHHFRGESAMAIALREAAKCTRVIACSAYPADSKESLFQLRSQLADAHFMRLSGSFRTVLRELYFDELDPAMAKVEAPLFKLASRYAADACEAFRQFPEFHAPILRISKSLEGGFAPSSYSALALLDALASRHFTDTDLKGAIPRLLDLHQALMAHERLTSDGKFAFISFAAERLWNYRVEAPFLRKNVRRAWKNLSSSPEFSAAYELAATGTPFEMLGMHSDKFDSLVQLFKTKKDEAYQQFWDEGRLHLVRREECDHIKEQQIEKNLRGYLTHVPDHQHIIFSNLVEVVQFQRDRINHRLQGVSSKFRRPAVSFTGTGSKASGGSKLRQLNLTSFSDHDAAVLVASSAAAEGHNLPGIRYGHVYNASAKPIEVKQREGRVGRLGWGVMHTYLSRGTQEAQRFFRTQRKISKLELELQLG